MRAITNAAVKAFLARQSFKGKNTRTDGDTLYLHNNAVARHRNHAIEVTLSWWNTPTTRDRVNGVLAKLNADWRVFCHKGDAYAWRFSDRTKVRLNIGQWYDVRWMSCILDRAAHGEVIVLDEVA